MGGKRKIKKGVCLVFGLGELCVRAAERVSWDDRSGSGEEDTDDGNKVCFAVHALRNGQQ